MQTLEPMLTGAEIPFSIDMAAKIPASGSISSAIINVISGASSVAVDRVTVSGTKVIFWVEALAAGWAVFDVFATFSDTSEDGERVQVRVI